MESIMIVFVGFFATLVVIKSIKILDADDGIEVFLFAEYRSTYLPEKFRESLTAKQQKKYDRKKIETPLFWSMVFGLWPIYKLTRFPTSPAKLTLHTSSIKTTELDTHPRVSVQAKPTMGIRFLTVQNTILGIGFDSARDLTVKDTIKGEGDVEYEDTLLAKGLRNQTKNVIRDALRKAGGHFYYDSGRSPANGNVSGGGNIELEINKSSTIWEKWVLFELAQPESDFAQSKILIRPSSITANPDLGPADRDDFIRQLRTCEKEDFFGEDVLSVDLSIANITISPKVDDVNAEAQNAENERYVAIQQAAGILVKGQAQARVNKEQGFAQAEVIEKQGAANAAAAAALQTSLNGADPATIAALLLLENKDVTFIPVGGSIPEIINSIGRKKP